MDINFLLDYINVVTLGICLCVGFALKYAKLFTGLYEMMRNLLDKDGKKETEGE